jgi:hypothetical protein
VLDLTASSTLSPGNFAALMTSTTPPTGTSPIALGPNAGGAIVLNNVSAGSTTMYLVGGVGSNIVGSGTFGLLGVYVPHDFPIALTGSVRQIDPTLPHAVAAGFSELFDATGAASFFVRRTGDAVRVQTFNGCPIAGTCILEVPPVVDWWPDTHDRGIPAGTQSEIRFTFASDLVSPTPLSLSTFILVNQGNENFFNVDEEQRKQRATRGGQ